MSNSIKVKPEEMAYVVKQMLKSYSKARTQETKELIKETSEICKEEIRKASPVRTGDYKKGWDIKQEWEDCDSLRMRVRNKTDWQLTHLLENGHANPCAITMTPMLPWVMETPLSNTSWQTVNAYRRVPPEIRRNNP